MSTRHRNILTARQWQRILSLIVLPLVMLLLQHFTASSTSQKPQLDTQTQQFAEVGQPKTSSAFYQVDDVVDGDTIKVDIAGSKLTLRLIGIDTPEVVDPRKPVQCFGRQASEKAKQLLSGQRVRIEADPSQGNLDKYGRSLRYIYLQNGTSYNQLMIAEGYAHEYTYDKPYKCQSQFKQAQIDAQAQHLGFWNASTCNGNTLQPA